MSAKASVTPVSGGITAAAGFKTAGVHCGIKAKPGALDLAVIAVAEQVERLRPDALRPAPVDQRVLLPVRDPDLFKLEPQLLDGLEQHLQIATRVDDGGLQGLVVPDERTVLLESGDGDGEVLEHVQSLMSYSIVMGAWSENFSPL